MHRLLLALLGLSLAATMATAQTPVSSGSARAEPVSRTPLAQSTTPPQLDAARRQRMRDAVERSTLPGPAPAIAGAPSAAPLPASRSLPTRIEDAGDAVVVRLDSFGSEIPGGYKSNVIESSVAMAGRWSLVTGNWFAAWDKNGPGRLPVFIDPYADMPDFCCDQVAIYAPSRNLYVWLRQGIASTNAFSGNYENEFRLSLASEEKTRPNEFSCTYSFRPLDVNGAWTDLWFDYPHMQVGADFLYVAYNLFDETDSFVRTVVLRLPLDALRDCDGFSYNYFETTAWFTLVPVQGAEHTMYLASNWPTSGAINTKLGIWTWPESSSAPSFVERTITSWTTTGRGAASCGSPNWAARLDQRVLTGARYEVSGSDVSHRGRKVVGWWWNVAQGGAFVKPYIEAAAFFENDLSQVPGLQGRPFVWNDVDCFAYPSAAANVRGDLGLLMNYGPSSTQRPDVVFAIADDVVPTPPGWTLSYLATSGAKPSDEKWGDYNTLRPSFPAAGVWAGAAHHIPGFTNCSPIDSLSCTSPLFFVFGRERDIEGYRRWRNK